MGGFFVSQEFSLAANLFCKLYCSTFSEAPNVFKNIPYVSLILSSSAG